MQTTGLARKRWSKKAILGYLSIAMLVTLACALINIPPEPDAEQEVGMEAAVQAAIESTRQAETILQATIDAAVVATQQAQPVSEAVNPPVAATETPSTTDSITDVIVEDGATLTDRRDVTEVIASEVNGIISQDLDGLERLYASDAIIIDRGGTADDTSDDRIWDGWPSIAAHYEPLFNLNIASLTLVDLAVNIDGVRATGRYTGMLLNSTYFDDEGVYTLAWDGERWLITRLEFGLKPNYAYQSLQDDGLYRLVLGSQHRYEEPWGWDRGDPCRAWQDGNFDDTKPNYRGFNVELTLTNNTEEKVPDTWPIRFTTAHGALVKACQYAYEGAGPLPDESKSATFFTVVEKGDYVEKITLSLNGQTINLCLDGTGDWWRCELGQ